MGLDVFRLDGKKAIVLGASKGIGKAIALALARQGADLLIASRDMQKTKAVEAEILTMGTYSKACQVDVSNLSEIKNFFRTEVEAFGNIDILIYNAAFTIFKSFMESTLEDFDNIVGTNVKGAMQSMQLVADKMIKQGKGGKIIVVSSVNSVATLPRQALYSSTKSMLDSLMQSAAAGLAQYNIRVNSILPGYTWTDLDPNLKDKNYVEEGKNIPLGYVALPEDIADVVAFMSSDASRYMCGSSVLVDGGLLLRK
jgi:NAD(P)-dependent dehydrogenase (short-subunit alcohol dehydrogenase family)